VPELDPYLRKVAAKWAKGSPLPKRMMLGPEPHETKVRAALDRIFGGRVFYRNGKLTVEIPAELQNDKHLVPLAEALGVKRHIEKPAAIDPVEIFQRLRLMYPQLGAVHKWIQTAPEIDRLLKSQQEQLIRNLLKTIVYLDTNKTPVTLSRLGSLFFNDSKILRDGIPRKLLGGLLNCRLADEDSPETRENALKQFNIIDNPITTQVTLFGPVCLLRNDEKLSWIADRFSQDEPVTLNSCNLQQVNAIQLPKTHNTVITSENAAPFHELISGSLSAIIIYTEGYPNAEVRRVLSLLAQAGATCLHWGDTDPDGLRIASIINELIPTTLYRCKLADMQQNKDLLRPLDPIKRSRAIQMLNDQPNFPFKEELEFSINHGWLEQESFMS
jgi:hypothetical protein